jgi:hypothetical protein
MTRVLDLAYSRVRRKVSAEVDFRRVRVVRLCAYGIVAHGLGAHPHAEGNLVQCTNRSIRVTQVVVAVVVVMMVVEMVEYPRERAGPPKS